MRDRIALFCGLDLFFQWNHVSTEVPHSTMPLAPKMVWRLGLVEGMRVVFGGRGVAWGVASADKSRRLLGPLSMQG